MKSEVAVVGGGATGTSIFRDLTLRGINAVLIERGTIGKGTTSASHQNLVGGMRYVVKDPLVAKECAEENEILSKISPDIIGKINNYFLGFRNDYTEKALKEAKRLDIRAEEIDTKDAFREIPELNHEIEIIIETNDRNINAERFCYLNCFSAIENGGTLIENTTIQKIESIGGYFSIETNQMKIKTEYIVNATGSWVNRIADKMGITLPVTYSQGTIIVLPTVSPRGLQYLRKPSDGDAYIVHASQAWLGTTSTAIENPDSAKPESWADEYLKKEFSIILPIIKSQNTLGRFTGVRVLLKENGTENGRSLSRDFKIIETPENFLHTIGGKLTTARLMAEKTVDTLCKKTGNRTRCRTHIEPLKE